MLYWLYRLHKEAHTVWTILRDAKFKLISGLVVAVLAAIIGSVYLRMGTLLILAVVGALLAPAKRELCLIHRLE
jgi:hypothetical protein